MPLKLKGSVQTRPRKRLARPGAPLDGAGGPMGNALKKMTSHSYPLDSRQGIV